MQPVTNLIEDKVYFIHLYSKCPDARHTPVKLTGRYKAALGDSLIFDSVRNVGPSTYRFFNSEEKRELFGRNLKKFLEGDIIVTSLGCSEFFVSKWNEVSSVVANKTRQDIDLGYGGRKTRARKSHKLKKSRRKRV